MVLNGIYFFLGVLLGIVILYYESALPPPFNHIGYKQKKRNRLRLFGIRIHHSTLGIIGLISSYLLNSTEQLISTIIFGTSIIFLISQIPEIVEHRTLFWEDEA